MEPDGLDREKSGHTIICPGNCITQRESCYDETYIYFCLNSIRLYLRRKVLRSVVIVGNIRSQCINVKESNGK